MSILTLVLVGYGVMCLLAAVFVIAAAMSNRRIYGDRTYSVGIHTNHAADLDGAHVPDNVSAVDGARPA